MNHGYTREARCECTHNTEQWFNLSQDHGGGALGWHTVIKKKKKLITREELHLVSTCRTVHPRERTSQAALAVVSMGHKTGAVQPLRLLFSEFVV